MGGETTRDPGQLLVGILFCGCAENTGGILVIHYSDMEDEVLQKVIGALEENFFIITV